MYRFLGVLIVAFALGHGAAAVAQEDWSSDWNDSRSSVRCVPECRAGYECQQGECTPKCSPPCERGFLCTAGGRCVRTAAPEPPPRVESRGPAPNQCAPTCRRGFVCVGGQCISACNPPCFSGEMCTDQRECVPATQVQDEDDEAVEAGSRRNASADSIVNIHFNVLGLLQFGLTPTLEVGEKVSGYLRLRPLNTGLASYLVLPEGDNEFDWGLGAALGMHVFTAGDGNMRGLFGGPALEYVFVRTKDRHTHFANHATHALVPQLDLGYRWGFGSFLLGFGGAVGLVVPLSGTDTAFGSMGCPNGCGDGERDLLFVANLFLDVGFFL